MMRKILLLLFGLFIINSCQDRDADVEIFYSLFPKLVKMSYHDIRLVKDPPFTFGMDSIEKKNYLEKWEERRIKLLADTTRTVILIPDTIYFDKHDTDENIQLFKNHFKNEDLIINPVDLNKTAQLRINRLKTDNKRIRFEYVSKYPEDKKINYRWRPDREFDGILRVSRIRFDSTKNYGYFILSYYRGPLDGWGSVIFIKKVDENWIIDGEGGGWVS